MRQRHLQPNLHAHLHPDDIPAGGLPFVPALSVLPMVRQPLGLGLLRPRTAISSAFITLVLPLALELIPSVHEIPASSYAYGYLAGFAVSSFALSQSLFLWRIFGRYTRDVHSADGGYSFLAYTTAWPIFLTEVVIVPAVVALAGWFIAQTLSLALGWWLMASGASLALLALWEGTRRYAARHQAIDGMIQAQTSLDATDPKRRKTRNGNVVDFADFG